MTSLLGKQPAREKRRKEWEEDHGLSANKATLAGVSSYAPTTYDSKFLPPGSIVPTAYGSVKVYNGEITQVDSSVYEREVAEHTLRQREIKKLAKEMIICGDYLAKKYMRGFYNLLEKDTMGVDEQKTQLIAWLKADGFTKTEAEKIVDKHNEVDARPSTLATVNEASDKFSEGLNKLLFVLRFCPIVFTGRTAHPNPDPVESQPSNLFDRAPTQEANVSAKAVQDLTNRLGFDPAR